MVQTKPPSSLRSSKSSGAKKAPPCQGPRKNGAAVFTAGTSKRCISSRMWVDWRRLGATRPRPATISGRVAGIFGWLRPAALARPGPARPGSLKRRPWRAPLRRYNHAPSRHRAAPQLPAPAPERERLPAPRMSIGSQECMSQAPRACAPSSGQSQRPAAASPSAHPSAHPVASPVPAASLSAASSADDRAAGRPTSRLGRGRSASGEGRASHHETSGEGVAPRRKPAAPARARCRRAVDETPGWSRGPLCRRT
jgi:hypothetical protein